MLRGLFIWGMLAVLGAGFPVARAESSPEICQAHDDKADAAAVDAYFVANLPEHSRYTFSRGLVSNARAQAKLFLEQRITDRRNELCAAHLKIAEDVKAAAVRNPSADCVAATTVTLLDQYAARAASAYDLNRQTLAALLNRHLQNLKVQLFQALRGPSASLEGSFQGAPLASATQSVKFDWVKLEASAMGAEAHTVWGGGANAAANPLVQRNAQLGVEAVRARQERDSAKIKLHTDGKVPASCSAAK